MSVVKTRRLQARSIRNAAQFFGKQPQRGNGVAQIMAGECEQRGFFLQRAFAASHFIAQLAGKRFVRQLQFERIHQSAVQVSNQIYGQHRRHEQDAGQYPVRVIGADQDQDQRADA